MSSRSPSSCALALLGAFLLRRLDAQTPNYRLLLTAVPTRLCQANLPRFEPEDPHLSTLSRPVHGLRLVMASLQPNMFTTPPHPRAGGSEEGGPWASPASRRMGPPPSPSPSTSGPFRPVPRAHWVQSTPPDQTGVTARTRSLLVPAAPIIPDARGIQTQSHTIRSQRDLWQEEERFGMPGIETTYDPNAQYHSAAEPFLAGSSGETLSWVNLRLRLCWLSNC